MNNQNNATPAASINPAEQSKDQAAIAQPVKAEQPEVAKTEAAVAPKV